MTSFVRRCLYGVGAATFLLLPHASQAASFVQDITYRLEQPFGGKASIGSFGEYVQLLYQYALGLVGIIAVVLIMFGGLRWITAAGNESVIGEAKEIVVSAVTGLVIALLSYTILVFINPRLVDLPLSVEIIGIQGADDIFKYPKCTEAAYNKKECISQDGEKIECGKIVCGEIGALSFAYADNRNCRGQVCGAGTGGCYSDAKEPTKAQSCSRAYCGEWIESCKKKAGSNDKQLYDCLCQYYSNQANKWLGIPPTGSYSTWTDINKTAFAQTCGETMDQAKWENELINNPTKYGYTLPASQVGKYSWNCGFSCKVNEYTTQVVAGAVGGGGTVSGGLPAIGCKSTRE